MAITVTLPDMPTRDVVISALQRRDEEMESKLIAEAARYWPGAPLPAGLIAEAKRIKAALAALRESVVSDEPRPVIDPFQGREAEVRAVLGNRIPDTERGRAAIAAVLAKLPPQDETHPADAVCSTCEPALPGEEE